jgi:hypothetical protein
MVSPNVSYYYLSKRALDYSPLTYNFITQNSTLILCMFGSPVTRIDFDIIDSVKLILAKINFKLKWLMFGYIHAKSESNKKFECKNQF